MQIVLSSHILYCVGYLEVYIYICVCGEQVTCNSCSQAVISVCRSLFSLSLRTLSYHLTLFFFLLVCARLYKYIYVYIDMLYVDSLYFCMEVVYARPSTDIRARASTDIRARAMIFCLA